MAINYPGALDTTTQFGQPTGGSLLATGPDHAGQHDNLSSLGTTLENVLGTTGGTGVIGAFVAGDLAVRHQGGTFQQVMFGTVNLKGQATASGTIAGGFYGTMQTKGGTILNAFLQTPTTDTILANNATIGVGFTNSIYPPEGSLTDSAGGTLAVDARQGQIYYCVLGTAAGNRTISSPTNPSPYQQLTYAFKSSGSANGTLVWGTIFRFSQDSGTPALGTGVGWNYYGWRYNAIDTKWDFIGQSKNLI